MAIDIGFIIITGKSKWPPNISIFTLNIELNKRSLFHTLVLGKN